METYLWIFASAMIIIGVYAMFATLMNLRHFHRLGKASDETSGPLISVVIPARNEEHNLPRLLDSLTAQSYRNIEILVINDQSSDGTERIIREYEAKDGRIHGFSTDPEHRLSQNGKINALLQLIPHASGEYIIATDADTQHSEDCVAHAYAVMKKNGLDIISGFPTEICPSFMGTVNISAMMLTSILIPHFLVYHFPIPSASFAIGQFIMMRADAYRETGGYSNINGTICDDVGIVRLFVRKKKKYAFISISDYVKCYMYGTAKEAFKGIERSIAGVFPPNVLTLLPLFALVAVLLHMALCPAIAAVFFLVLGPAPGIWILLSGWILFCLAWYTGCRAANWRKRISIACPLTLIQISLMYLHGLYTELSGKGFEWKGRSVR